MGVLPLQFREGESIESLGLTGEEVFDVVGLAGVGPDEPLPRELTVRVAAVDAGSPREFPVRLRVDTPTEAAYLRHGGILPYVLRSLRRRSA